MQKHFFKCLPKKHLEAFLLRGSLKIGTLYEYRKIEKYGGAVGDKNEGLHKTELFLPGGGQIDLASTTPEAEFFRKHVLRPDQTDSKVKIVLEDGASLMAHSNSQDLYIYCMTSTFDEAAMKIFGCDTCLEIIRPDEFFAAISRRMRHKGKFEGVVPIQYMDKTTHYLKPHRLHPALMKDTEYAYQSEWRAIWAPTRPPRKPLLMEVPRAIRHCRQYVP